MVSSSENTCDSTSVMGGCDTDPLFLGSGHLLQRLMENINIPVLDVWRNDTWVRISEKFKKHSTHTRQSLEGYLLKYDQW